VWDADHRLVGGGYGVAAGRAFTIESQFARESHTSKIGFAMLNWHLAHWGFLFNDNKGPTRNVVEAGFRPIPRPRFMALLAEAQRGPGKSGRWEVETDLPTVANWRSQRDRASVSAQASPQSFARNRVLGESALLLPIFDAIDEKGLAFAELATFAAAVI
jgi:leucyl/phenylalanyl-tRNA--protein transferase